MGYCSVSLKGIASDCNPSKGGIKKIYIGSYIDNPFTMSGSTVTGFNSAVTEIFEYNVRKGTSTMTSTLNLDVAAGVNYVSTELSLTFLRMDKDKKDEMDALKSGDMFAVIMDANGNYFALGVEEPVICSAATGQTGTARTDSNNYQITLTDEQGNFPPLLDDTAVSALEALVK